MMPKTFLMGIALLATTLLAPPADAACVDFDASPGELTVQYDPFSSGMLDRPFAIRVRRLDPAVSGVRFLLAPATSARSQSEFMPQDFELFWSREAGRRVLALGAEQPNATNGALVSFGKGASGDSASETFRVQVPPGRSVTAGDHFIPLDIRYQCLTAGKAAETNDVLSGSQLLLNIQVPQQISSYVGSVGQRRGTIDFGLLQGTAAAGARDIAVTVLATIPYLVDLQTEYGALKRSPADAYGIAYQLRVSGIAVDSSTRLSCGATPARGGRSHKVQVELDNADVRRVPAGRYSEIITLTFSPRLGLSGGEGCGQGA